MSGLSDFTKLYQQALEYVSHVGFQTPRPDLTKLLSDPAAHWVEAKRKVAHLTELDRAIGDGDHGINMQRGFNAVAEARDEICALALPDALQKIGMTLVMTGERHFRH